MDKTKKTSTSRKQYRGLLGFVYFGVGVFLVYSLFSNAMLVFLQKRDIVGLENQKEILLEEKEQLENEIELLNDEDYVTRYARENYVFTRDGEQVSIIPSVGE
jgi:cell division protein FtsB